MENRVLQVSTPEAPQTPGGQAMLPRGTRAPVSSPPLATCQPRPRHPPSVPHFPSVILVQSHPSTDRTSALTPLSDPSDALCAAVSGLIVQGGTVTNDSAYWNEGGTLRGPSPHSADEQTEAGARRLDRGRRVIQGHKAECHRMGLV